MTIAVFARAEGVGTAARAPGLCDSRSSPIAKAGQTPLLSYRKCIKIQLSLDASLYNLIFLWSTTQRIKKTMQTQFTLLLSLLLLVTSRVGS